MKIYKTADECRFHEKNEGKVYISGCEGNSLFFDNGKISFENYEVHKTLGRFFCIGGNFYRRIEITLDEETTYSLINDSGKAFNLPETIIKKMYSSSISSVNGYEAFIFRVRNKGVNTTFVFDFLSSSMIGESLDSFYSCILDGFVYGFDGKNHCFIKRDINLNKIWEQEVITSAAYAILNLKFHNRVISFIGPETSEFDLNTRRENGGILTGFSDETGMIVWELPIPEAIDDLGLYHDKLYVAIYDKLLIIDPETGDILTSIATNTSLPSYRVTSAHVFVDDSYIYFTHAEDELLLIYDLNSHELLYTIPMPQGYRIKGHHFTDNMTGKHYFTMHNLTQDVASFPSLEVDPLNFSTQVEFESEPDYTIELVAINHEPLAHEVVIKMQSSRLDDALRYGEIYTRDSASHHGYNHGGRTFGGRQPTPSFNGVVRFILSGCHEDEHLVLEKLSMMEKRFVHWNERYPGAKGMYACIDKFKPVQLITEYKV
jgi:hypothetical protein